MISDDLEALIDQQQTATLFSFFSKELLSHLEFRCFRESCAPGNYVPQTKIPRVDAMEFAFSWGFWCPCTRIY